MTASLLLLAALAASPAQPLPTPGQVVRADFHAAAGWLSAWAHQGDHVEAGPMARTPGGLAGLPPVAAGLQNNDCAPPTSDPLPAIPQPPVLCTSGTDPAPSPPVDPLMALMQASVAADAELAAATDAEAKASDRKAAALAMATSASNAFAAEWTKRHPLPTPTPVPVVPPTPAGPVTSILVVTSTATCQPCRQLQPVIDGLKTGGMPISVLDTGNAADAQAAVAWKATAIPTMVMLVNGNEQSRAVGYFDKAAIQDWYTRTAQWAAIKFPPPKVSDEVPPPPRRTP